MAQEDTPMDPQQIEMARWLGTLGFEAKVAPDWLTNGNGVTVRLPRPAHVHVFVNRDGVAWSAKFDDAPRQSIAAVLATVLPATGQMPVMIP
jgi:hypothetical protein